jgi:hypothetical protein
MARKARAGADVLGVDIASTNAFEAAEKGDRAGNLRTELEGLFNSQNKSTNDNASSIAATFLRVTVVPG